MHVFSYSKRAGTAAITFKHGPDKKIIKERTRVLRGLGKRFSLDFAERFIGKTQEALLENERERATGLLTGYTGRYIRVFLDGPDSLKNRLIPIKITTVNTAKNAVFGLA